MFWFLHPQATCIHAQPIFKNNKINYSISKPIPFLTLSMATCQTVVCFRWSWTVHSPNVLRRVFSDLILHIIVWYSACNTPFISMTAMTLHVLSACMGLHKTAICRSTRYGHLRLIWRLRARNKQAGARQLYWRPWSQIGNVKRHALVALPGAGPESRLYSSLISACEDCLYESRSVCSGSCVSFCWIYVAAFFLFLLLSFPLSFLLLFTSKNQIFTKYFINSKYSIKAYEII